MSKTFSSYKFLHLDDTLVVTNVFNKIEFLFRLHLLFNISVSHILNRTYLFCLNIFTFHNEGCATFSSLFNLLIFLIKFILRNATRFSDGLLVAKLACIFKVGLLGILLIDFAQLENQGRPVIIVLPF